MGTGKTAQQLEVERIDAGGDPLRDGVGEPITIRRPPGGKMAMGVAVRVRMTGEQYDQLRAAAAARGIGPSTLLRMWGLERLAQERELAR